MPTKQGENNSLSVLVQACHPGYTTSNESINSSLCVCDNNNDDIIRCDDQKRYVFLRVSVSFCVLSYWYHYRVVYGVEVLGVHY